jgi:hypothetical protein
VLVATRAPLSRPQHPAAQRAPPPLPVKPLPG